MWQQYLRQIEQGDIKTLSRCISLVENEVSGYQSLLQMLPATGKPIIGITGAPGAGKSTLTDAIIGELTCENKRVAVLCIDPSSPFNLGALLGDRVRMNDWYNNPLVYIRSLATRGSLGGLHPKIIEITDLLKAAPFDYIIVETVGVGQSEVEIAGLADVTIVVMVPEGGDEVQSMKAGLMEIADIFVVNKADRPGADAFVNNLRLMLAPAFTKASMELPILKTVATNKSGIKELYETICLQLTRDRNKDKHLWLLTEKTFLLIQQKRMQRVNKGQIRKAIELAGNAFNLYRFVEEY